MLSFRLPSSRYQAIKKYKGMNQEAIICTEHTGEFRKKMEISVSRINYVSDITERRILRHMTNNVVNWDLMSSEYDGTKTKISSTAWMATMETHGGRKGTQTHTGVLGGKVILGPAIAGNSETPGR